VNDNKISAAQTILNNGFCPGKQLMLAKNTLMDTRGRPNFNAIVVDHEAPMHASRGG